MSDYTKACLLAGVPAFAFVVSGEAWSGVAWAFGVGCGVLYGAWEAGEIHEQG